MRTCWLFILTVVFLPPLQAQNFERIVFDKNDSTEGYYLAVPPKPGSIKATIVVLTSFLHPEQILTETKLHSVAYANDMLTIIAYTKQKLYADSAVVERVSAVLKDVVSRYSADTGGFVLAGYDQAGNIALRYTELSQEKPGNFPVHPKAVFGIDAPVDLFWLWNWSERQIKKDYSPGAAGDAKYYLDVMKRENGAMRDNSERYKILTPFYREDEMPGNEKYLRNIAVRLYYDTDIDWQLKNRRNSYYDTKMADGAELINRLLLAGNEHAEFIAAKHPGVRSNGMRNPTAMSIVDEPDCIQWIKKSLDIFDPVTWVPPYNLPVPVGWQADHFSLPPDFAPQIMFKGVEDTRFSPGWGDPKSEEHWSYGFLWWLNGSPNIDAAILESSLQYYFSGLVSRNITSRHIAPDKIIPTATSLKKIKPAGNDQATYNGSISMLDYHTSQPMILRCLIHVRISKTTNNTAVYFELSPASFGKQVWKTLDTIGENMALRN